MIRPTLKSGKRIGPWTIEKWLGSGANGEVWSASSTKHKSVAVKVLTRSWSDPDSEPYRRFSAEVEVLRRIGDHPGVLPLLDAALDIDRNRHLRPWLATPVATSVPDALLESASLGNVVEIAAAVAQTLAELASKHGVCHRDIKPSNLFRLDNRWCVGDFGLVTYADKEAVTMEGAKIGPQYYIAPEQLLDNRSDPGPGDVYSLAKTIWVLATGHTFPCPGVLDHEDERTRLTSYIVAERARAIELLLAEATQLDPGRRPTMQQFADELMAWLSPSAQPTGPALEDALKRRAATLLVPHYERADLAKKRLEHVAVLAQNAERVMHESIAPALRQYNLRKNSPVALSALVPGIVPSGWGEGIVYQCGPAIDYGVSIHNGKTAVHFSMYLDMRLSKSGETKLTAVAVVWDRGGWKEVLWHDSRAAPCESALEENAFRELLQGLSNAVPAGVGLLLDRFDKVARPE